MSWASFIEIGYAASWALIPSLLRRNKPPVSTLNWIWVLVFFPWLGALAYLLIGSDRLARRHLTKSRQIGAGGEWVKRAAEHDGRLAELRDTLEPAERAVADLLSCVNNAPMAAANEVELLVDAQRFYPSLIAAIGRARKHVHVEFYIFRADQPSQDILGSLVAAARRGVEVRLLCDRFGSFRTGESFFAPLVEAGGSFAWFRTVNPFHNRWVFNLRNHRKIQIIDGETVFVGGMNVGREYLGEDPAYGSWRDVQVRVTGGVAAVVQRAFADDWFYATDEMLTAEKYYPVSLAPAHHVAQVLSDGPDETEDPIQMSIVGLLNSARERAWLTAGYFVPNEPLITAMKLCASRGVDTRLLISAKGDHPLLVQIGRSYYEELLEYGVRIFEYEKGMNHAKVATFDSRWLMVGSANFDIRSMRLNFELNVVVHEPAAARQLEAVLQVDYEADSKEIHLEEFRERGIRQRFLESAFRPLAPLM